MIGAGAVLHVPELQDEIARCGVDHKRLTIDPQAMIITEEDRKKEKRLQGEISSTGSGVGLATARRIADRGLKSVRLARDVKELRPFVRNTYLELEDAFRNDRRVALEGTQGHWS